MIVGLRVMTFNLLKKSNDDELEEKNQSSALKDIWIVLRVIHQNRKVNHLLQAIN